MQHLGDRSQGRKEGKKGEGGGGGVETTFLFDKVRQYSNTHRVEGYCQPILTGFSGPNNGFCIFQHKYRTSLTSLQRIGYVCSLWLVILIGL